MPGTKEGAAKRLATRSDTSVLERVAPPTQYVVGHRPLKFGDATLAPGDPVPGAEDWPRVESWVRTGRIVKR